MMTFVLNAVSALLGVLASEIFDVWYDSTHAEGIIQPFDDATHGCRFPQWRCRNHT